MISVIVPVYNVEAYLPQCLDSILSQTYTDLEILLIDDGSTDRSGKICDQYAERDSRIRVFHTENRGLSAARNLGLDHAHGDYIGFVDSDDWIEPDMYESLLFKANQTNADITECGILREFPEKTVECKRRNDVFSGDDAILALLRGDLGNGVWNKLWKSSCFKNIRFPEGRVFEDTATTYRVFNSSKSICSTDIFKYHYRQREKSLSKGHDMRNLVSYWLTQRERYENLKEQVDDRLEDVLLRKCALAAARTWAYTFDCSQVDQENFLDVVREMSIFTNQKIPIFGKMGWKLHLRIGIFFPHFYHDLSFKISWQLNHFYKWFNGKSNPLFKNGN